MLKANFKKVIVALFVAAGVITHIQLARADDIDVMRKNWAAFLTGNYVDSSDADIKSSITGLNQDAMYQWQRLNKDSLKRSQLWADLKYNYSKDITTSYRRLGVMALAYSTEHGKLYHDKLLLAAIFSGMQWLYDHCYNENTPLPVPAEGSDIHNWWDYKIGTPLEINNTVLLLYEAMSKSQREQYMRAVNHFTPDFTDAYTRKPSVTQFTAANRVWVSTVICLRGIILKDESQIALASKSLIPVFEYAETGDGFYRDGSFIQHVKHPYTGGYGISLLGRLVEELYLLAKSPWALKNEDVQHIYNWIYDSFEPLIYKGNVMSMVEGREISRPDAEGNRKGVYVTESLALLAKVAPVGDAARLRGMIKSWYGDDRLNNNFFHNMPLSYITVVKEIALNNKPATAPADDMYKQFAHMDRAVQKALGYAFGISMYSARIYNYETRTNYENIKGWHTGDGQTYLYNGDADQFNDNFWATVNYYHLPGTTVEDQTQIAGFRNSKSYWAGGVALSGKYGVTGFDLAAAAQTITAKKSWFMFDGKIVALGAGITNHDGADVNTYIEQRKLPEDGSGIFTVNGEVIPNNPDGNNVPLHRNNVHWAHLGSNIPGADIGYYFPEDIVLNIERAKQSGAWKDVNVNYSDKVYTRNYLTMWKNQGNETTDVNAGNNKYAYVLLPGLNAAQTKAYALQPDIQIIENTARVQAVKSKSLHIVAANFWQNTFTDLKLDDQPAYLSCNTQAAMMVQKQDDSLTIAVSDPTMLHNTIVLTLKEKASRVISQDPAFSVLSMEPVTKLSVNTSKLGGQTATIKFATK